MAKDLATGSLLDHCVTAAILAIALIRLSIGRVDIHTNARLSVLTIIDAAHAAIAESHRLSRHCVVALSIHILKLSVVHSTGHKHATVIVHSAVHTVILRDDLSRAHLVALTVHKLILAIAWLSHGVHKRIGIVVVIVVVIALTASDQGQHQNRYRQGKV